MVVTAAQLTHKVCGLGAAQNELPQDIQQQYKACSMVVILVGASKQSTQQMDTKHHANKA